MKRVIFQAHPLLVAQERAGTDTQKNLMGVLVFMLEVVGVTSKDDWNI